jgi:hypothetical protein
VIGTLNLNYILVKPLIDEHEDIIGTRIEQVISVNPNGSVPEWMKKKISKKQGLTLIHMVEFLQNQIKSS